MTDFPAQDISTSSGGTLTERSGAAAATDTIPAGCRVVARNTGAGAHTLVLGVGALHDGLAVASRTISFTAGEIKGFTVPPSYQNATGRVPMHVGEGTQAEVKYYVLGA